MFLSIWKKITENFWNRKYQKIFEKENNRKFLKKITENFCFKNWSSVHVTKRVWTWITEYVHVLLSECACVTERGVALRDREGFREIQSAVVMRKMSISSPGMQKTDCEATSEGHMAWTPTLSKGVWSSLSCSLSWASDQVMGRTPTLPTSDLVPVVLVTAAGFEPATPNREADDLPLYQVARWKNLRQRFLTIYLSRWRTPQQHHLKSDALTH